MSSTTLDPSDSLEQAVSHLLRYLDGGGAPCTFVFEPAYRRVADEIRRQSPLTPCIDVAATPHEKLREALTGNTACLAFDRRYGPDRPDWQELLVDLARNRPEPTLTLCDCAPQFEQFFSVDPRLIVDFNRRLSRKVANARTMHVRDAYGTNLILEFDARNPWVSIDGFEEGAQGLTVNLPPGEVATCPISAKGSIAFVGGLLGTIPIGRKYGEINEPIILDVDEGMVKVLRCPDPRLAADLDFCLGHDAGANAIHEVGLGTHPCIVDLAGLNYSWEEKHYGFHLGVGASLAQQPGVERVTNHHLDFLFRSAELTLDGTPLFADGRYQL